MELLISLLALVIIYSRGISGYPTNQHHFLRLVSRQSVRNRQCSDGKTTCADNQTCCMLSTGTDGCCPLPYAVCCSDGKHCCPNDYACDPTDGKCTDQGKTSQVVLTTHTITTTTTSPSMVCPDNKHVCNPGQTCCLYMSNTTYGCCNFNEGVCCDDLKNCCPNGYTCGPHDSKCYPPNNPHTSVEVSAIPINRQQLQNIICGDQVSECPDNNTCCRINEQFGCCPLPNAVCCGDQEGKCCPNGYECNKDATCQHTQKKDYVIVQS